jgi:hypothetical protein
MSTITTAGTLTYTAPGGLRPRMPTGQSFDCGQSSVGIFEIPDGTSENTGFQISPDSMSVIKGYYLKNLTGFPISYAPNDWDSYTLSPGGEVKVMSDEDGSGENPIYYMYIYTEQNQDGAGTVEFAFFGEWWD